MVFPFSDFPGQSAHDVSDRVNTGESLGLRAAPRLPRPPCLSGILPVDDIAKIAVVFVFPVSDFRNLVTLVPSQREALNSCFPCLLGFFGWTGAGFQSSSVLSSGCPAMSRASWI